MFSSILKKRRIELRTYELLSFSSIMRTLNAYFKVVHRTLKC